MSEPLEDLMAKARRGKLRDEDRRRLEFGLNASLEAKLLYHAGSGFDSEPVVMTGDEMFIESLASDAARRFGPVPKNSRRRVSAVVAAVWAIAGIAAAGTAGVAYHLAGPFPSKDSKIVTAPIRLPTAKALSAAPTARLAPSSQCAPAIVPPDPKEAPRTAAWSIVATTPQTVQTLFQLANEARNDGRVRDAVHEYQRIQREFPASREAELSTMSLGMLELQRGNAQAALPQFRRVQATHPSPEAIWGEAQALHLLGRDEQARPLLEALLSRYPESAYAPAASKRLGTQD